LRLSHRECDCPRERFGGNRKFIDLADVLGDTELPNSVTEPDIDRAG
jgi:hypothetical protein